MIKEKYQLYHGDCLDGFKTLQDESVDLILTDVPYGGDYKNDFYDDSKDYVFSQKGNCTDSFRNSCSYFLFLCLTRF